MISYDDIIAEVFDNLREEWRSEKRVAEIKRSLLNTLREVHRLGREPSKEHSATFTESDSNLTMPNDFFVQKEVLFMDSDGVAVQSSELNREEFLRWNPVSIDYGGSIRDELANPTRISVTEENIQYDGTIGYYFQVNENSVDIVWKPQYDGQVKVLYASVPTLTTDEANQIQVLEFYSEMLVNGTTVRELRKRIGTAENEVELLSLKTQYAMFSAPYKEQLSEYLGVLRKKVQAKAVRPYLAPFDITMRQQ